MKIKKRKRQSGVLTLEKAREILKRANFPENEYNAAAGKRLEAHVFEGTEYKSSMDRIRFKSMVVWYTQCRHVSYKKKRTVRKKKKVNQKQMSLL